MTAHASTRAEGAREDVFRDDDATRALIADLEKELGVTGTANVFRKALALAKEAAAEVRARQEAYSANDLVYRLRAWGENDPDPGFFTGDLLGGVLMDCGRGSEAIIAAEARAARAEAEVAELKHRYEHCDENFDALMQIFNWAVQHNEFAVKHEGDRDAAALNVTDLADSFKDRATRAEAEVARLKKEADEALCLAEGPSTLLELARGSVSRGFELHEAQAEIARLTAENERMREALKVAERRAASAEARYEDLCNGPNG